VVDLASYSKRAAAVEVDLFRPPAVCRMNHERLPRHCKYCVIIVDDVTRPEYTVYIVPHHFVLKFTAYISSPLIIII
jgi:nickel-dependent lactate racemase